jgi:hypothetical protein
MGRGGKPDPAGGLKKAPALAEALLPAIPPDKKLAQLEITETNGGGINL